MGARIRALQRGGRARAGTLARDRRRGHRSVELPDRSGAYLYRAPSVAEVDPVVVAVRVEGDAALLAPRVAGLARQVDAGLHLRDIVTFDDLVAQEQMRMAVGSVIFGSVGSWRWSSRRPVCTR